MCVEPVSLFIDGKIKIYVLGHEPNKTASHASTKNCGRRRRSVLITCSLQHHGQINLMMVKSLLAVIRPRLGGSYIGVEPLGLLWSRKAAPELKKGPRLTKQNVTKSYNFTVKCFDGHITANEPSQALIKRYTVASRSRTDEVKKFLARNGRICRAVFISPGDGSFPSLVCSFKKERNKKNVVLLRSKDKRSS